MSIAGTMIDAAPPREQREVEVINQVHAELLRALVMHPTPWRQREGESLVREEASEFEQAVQHGTARDAAEEAIQVAATAMRYLLECVSDEDLNVAADRLVFSHFKKITGRAALERPQQKCDACGATAPLAKTEQEMPGEPTRSRLCYVCIGIPAQACESCGDVIRDVRPLTETVAAGIRITRRMCGPCRKGREHFASAQVHAGGCK